MADLSFPPHPAVTIEAVETVWHGRAAVQRVRYSVTGFDGRRVGPATWEVVRRGRAVAVLPHDPRTRRVVLIEQFRLPALAAGIDPMLIEAAAGLVDGEEDELAAAQRETLEETGLVVGALEPVGRFILTPGIADETIAIFLAETAIPPPPADGILRLTGMAHEHEHIRVLAVAEDDAFAWLDAGRIVNATTVIALQALRIRRLREKGGG